MTIRKHISNSPAPASGLSQILSQASPSQRSLQHDDLVKTEEDSKRMQAIDGVRATAYEVEEASGPSGNNVPPPISRDGYCATRTTMEGSSALPASLQIHPNEMTPRSSFGSQRSMQSESPNATSNVATVEGSGTHQLASNNPFLRRINNSGSSSTVPILTTDGAQGWATGPDEPPWYSHGEHLNNMQPSQQHTALNLPQANAHDGSMSTISPDFTIPSQKPRDIFNQSAWNDSTPLPLQQDQLQSEGRHQEPIERCNDGKDLPPFPPRNLDAVGPDLPPRRVEQAEDQPPPQPPRPRVDTATTGERGNQQSKAEDDRRRKQRSETYQIRLVNWYDASSSRNPRRSPIMVQNANGPCPLLALVNALVLSTPAGLDTALLDTLETREQVSLGLLLDAVIDELMSGRRGDAAQNLPDVSDLYAFLVNLHTGMNVNPSFVPNKPEVPHLMDESIEENLSSLTDTGSAGTFEDTREMKLYQTFAVPLIHGWIPPNTHPACTALKRSAKTYEDAQNLMFAEEELEGKISGQGLSQDEQRLLQDIDEVKYFLSSSATQLTAYGLDQIARSLKPGSIAILFRNDHFSTLYRHPRSGQLFTLVTDMGYAGHDEVVWESLVDISGEGSSFFAGDFRSVGNNCPPSSEMAEGENGWTTVTRRNADGRSQSDKASSNNCDLHPPHPTNAVPNFASLHLEETTPTRASPKGEQEDHDLALALQLQEEEEERERQELEARQRADELSQTYLGSRAGSRGRGARRARESRPSVPPRGSASGRVRGAGTRGGLPSSDRNAASSTEARPAVQPEDGEDAPPPTYDQASRGPAYHPPPHHPAHPNAFSRSPSNSAPLQSGLQRTSSAYAQNASGLENSPATSSPVSPPFANSPTPTSSRFGRNSSARNTTLGRGGASGVEGAPGFYRRNGREPAVEAERSRDCIIM